MMFEELVLELELDSKCLNFWFGFDPKNGFAHLWLVHSIFDFL